MLGDRSPLGKAARGDLGHVAWIGGFLPGQASSWAMSLIIGSAGSESKLWAAPDKPQAGDSCPTRGAPPRAQQSLWLPLQGPHSEQAGRQVPPGKGALSGGGGSLWGVAA